MDIKVTDAASRLAELKRIQEELEREKAALEEARRRRVEFQNGREEMLAHLIRGVGILEENEFATRRDAEQMARTLTDLRAALEKVQAINEQAWTEDNWSGELTKALATIENARMEWNSARLKWTRLDGTASPETHSSPQNQSLNISPPSISYVKLGLAIAWPVAAALLLGFLGVIIVLLRR